MKILVAFQKSYLLRLSPNIKYILDKVLSSELLLNKTISNRSIMSWKNKVSFVGCFLKNIIY